MANVRQLLQERLTEDNFSKLMGVDNAKMHAFVADAIALANPGSVFVLTDDEKVVVCRLAKKARADFVKTSTGFGPGGATVHDVALMRQAVGDSSMGVKASGGIRTLADAKKMIEAGATRIGASAGVKILKEATETARSD